MTVLIFLKTTEYLDFVNQNQFLKLSLKAVAEWYNSKIFSQEFHAFLNNLNNVSQTMLKQEGYDLYQQFKKPKTNNIDIS